MEHPFGAGTMIRDESATLPFARRRRAGRRARRVRRLVVAAATAVAALLWIGGVAYGGASSGAQRVVVHSGDTLWGLAASHYPGDDLQQRVVELEAVNHLDGAGLRPGEILTLPAP